MRSSVPIRLLMAIGLTCVAPAGADTLACANGLATVNSPDPAHLPLMCTATDRALAVLDHCDLRPPNPLEIAVAVLEDPSCLALFHCGEDRVEVLSPAAIAQRRKRADLFPHLSDDRVFESVIVHEIAHATLERTPCPFGDCPATNEYFAHTVQLLDFTATERAPLDAAIADRPGVAPEEINPFIYYLAPDLFIEKVWAHANQRDDICAQLRQVQDGVIFFDSLYP